MKHFLLLVFTALLGLMAFTHRNETVLTGKVVDNSGEVLIGAVVKILKGTELVKETVTDLKGNFSVMLEPGTYDIEFSYTGFESRRITSVPVLAGQVNTLNAKLNGGALLEEVVVTSYKVPLIEQDKIPSGRTLTSDEIHRTAATPAAESRAAKAKKAPDEVRTRSAKETEAITKGATSVDGGAVEIKGARSGRTDYYIDGIRVDGAPPAVSEKKYLAYEMPVMDDRISDAPEPMPGAPTAPAPRAGLLTAGEWNDLHNWSNHWTDLLTDGETDAYQKQYKFYPKQRYSLLLQNEQNLPISDAAVQLLDKNGNTLWEARTDNMGQAELWAGLFQAQEASAGAKLIAIIDGKKHQLGAAKPFSEGLNRHQIQRECQHAKALDIVWAVDATGSMGDELEYLKTELLDVIGQVKVSNPELGVRMGSVFYRDKGDDYLVKSSALNHDIAKTVDYIRQQSAGGGGDYPEAVHSALEEAIFRQPWSREAIARICFLVLDASPHQEPEVIESLQKSIREAAKLGIRIVPVAASGIQKDTEFLMKFFGLATNGSYVFLTDHSGIGGKHLEPTTDEYKVEPLNALLVRLITEYTSVPDCEGKSSIRFADHQPNNNQQQQAPVQYYPNPSSQQFSLNLPFDADKVTLYDAEGKAVRSLAQVSSGIHQIMVNDLAPGFYTLRIWKDNQVQSGKVLVLRS